MKAIRMLPAAVLAALSFPSAALADAAVLDDVLVTATRRAISPEQALPPVVIIDRAEIERSNAIDVAELLRYQAGIEIARNGGPGQVTSVFIRGANSTHTLVLVDGVKVNPGTAGGAALQNITPEMVERIEIVKGPRSSLYGSEAIGGVINIITRRAADPVELGASVQAGDYGLRGAGARAATRGERFGAGISFTGVRTDGFPTFQDDTEDRGFENDTLNAWARADLGALQLEASHWQAEGNTEYADFFRAPQDQDFENRLSRVQAAWQGRDWRSTLTVARVIDHIEQGELAFDPDDFVRTERDLVDWQNDLDFFPGLELTAGLSLSREETAGQSFGTPLEELPGAGKADRDEDAAYLQAGFALGAHRFVAAGRHTDHSAFGSVNTWNFEWGTAFGRDLAVTAGIGRGFRAPSASDLYAFGGNPALEPEVSRSVDFGLTYQPHPDHELGLALFRTEIDDLISFFDPDGFTGPLPGQNENIDEARIQGAELGWRAQLGRWRVDTELLLQQPEDRNTGTQLLRRAERMLTAQVVRPLGEHELGLQMLASGERRDFGDVRLAGYVLVNVTAKLELGRHWTLRARLENLLDRDYELADGYNTAGRGLYASLAYSY